MDRLLEIPSTHPFAGPVRAAEQELAGLVEAVNAGNAGRARVCARRAVGAFLQAAAGQLAGDPGSHAMANLRFVAEDGRLPATVRSAAERLSAGPRDEAAGAAVSSDPLADALSIINYFVRSASS